MPVNRVRRLAGIAVMAPLLLAGCDNNVLDAFDDVAGTYELTVFAGEPVPATFACQPGECGLADGGTFVAHDGTLVLHGNGSFVETNHYTQTPTGGSSESFTFTSTGTYTINADLISFSAPAQNGIGPRFFQGTVEFDRINYIEDGQAYEYRR